MSLTLWYISTRSVLLPFGVSRSDVDASPIVR